MFPPIFSLAAASDAVKAIFGTSPVRVWPFGEAPAKGATGYGVPYAVWQVASGVPDNYLATRPDADALRTQVDVYAANPTAARNATAALRDALETAGYVVSWNGESRDAATNLYRVSFDWEHITPRA